MFMVPGILACLAMVLIQRGDWQLASVLFVIGNIGVSGSLVFYDSLLPHIAKPEETDRVSTAGYALGYLGGGLLLLREPRRGFSAGGVRASPTRRGDEGVVRERRRLVAVFSIPLFRGVSEPPRGSKPNEQPGRAALAARVRAARRHVSARSAATGRRSCCFLAMLLYQDGIQTIIRMASVYGAEVGIDQTSQIAAFVMVQFIGIPCSLLFGALGTRIGTKRAIFIALAVYTLATLLGYFMTTVTHFFVLAALVGTRAGRRAGAEPRALLAAGAGEQGVGVLRVLQPSRRSSRPILGPSVFAVSIAVTGSSRSAVLFIVVVLRRGCSAPRMVDEEEGVRVARTDLGTAEAVPSTVSSSTRAPL